MNLENQPWKPQHLLSAEKLVGDSGYSAQDFLASTRALALQADFPGPACLLPHEISLYCQTGTLPDERLRHLDSCIFCRALGESLVPDPEKIQEFRRHVFAERSRIEAVEEQPSSTPLYRTARRWPAYLAAAVALVTITPPLLVHFKAPQTGSAANVLPPPVLAPFSPPPSSLRPTPPNFHPTPQHAASVSPSGMPVVEGTGEEVETRFVVHGPAQNRAHIERVVEKTLEEDSSYNQNVENYVHMMKRLKTGGRTDTLRESKWIIFWTKDPAESIDCAKFSRDGLTVSTEPHGVCAVKYRNARTEFELPPATAAEPRHEQMASALDSPGFTAAKASSVYDIQPPSETRQDRVAPPTAPVPATAPQKGPLL